MSRRCFGVVVSHAHSVHLPWLGTSRNERKQAGLVEIEQICARGVGRGADQNDGRRPSLGRSTGARTHQSSSPFAPLEQNRHLA